MLNNGIRECHTRVAEPTECSDPASRYVIVHDPQVADVMAVNTHFVWLMADNMLGLRYLECCTCFGHKVVEYTIDGKLFPISILPPFNFATHLFHLPGGSTETASAANHSALHRHELCCLLCDHNSSLQLKVPLRTWLSLQAPMGGKSGCLSCSWMGPPAWQSPLPRAKAGEFPQKVWLEQIPTLTQLGSGQGRSLRLSGPC